MIALSGEPSGSQQASMDVAGATRRPLLALSCVGSPKASMARLRGESTLVLGAATLSIVAPDLAHLRGKDVVRGQPKSTRMQEGAVHASSPKLRGDDEEVVMSHAFAKTYSINTETLTMIQVVDLQDISAQRRHLPRGDGNGTRKVNELTLAWDTVCPPEVLELKDLNPSAQWTWKVLVGHPGVLGVHPYSTAFDYSLQRKMHQLQNFSHYSIPPYALFAVTAIELYLCFSVVC